jgi:hypothetical protein
MATIKLEKANTTQNKTNDSKRPEPTLKSNKGWRQSGKPQTARITKKLATEFALMEPAPGDRPLSPRRNDLYKAFIKAKMFRSPEWAKAYCKETRTTYRVNGKHTSSILAGWNVAEDGAYPDLYATIATYECDTLADVAELYSTFDSKHTTRSTTDINWMFASTIPELAGISKWTIDRYVAGMNYNPNKSTYAEKTAAERAEILLTESAFCVWANTNLIANIETDVNTKRKFLMRSSIMYAIYQTYKVDKNAALKFWMAVREETDPTPDTPARKLARYLRSTTLNRQRTGTFRDSKTVVDIRESGAKAITAWNAYRKGEPTDLRYYPASAFPVAK